MNTTISFDIDGVLGKCVRKGSEQEAYYATHGSIIVAAGNSFGIPAGMLELSQRFHSDALISRVICYEGLAFVKKSTKFPSKMYRTNYDNIKKN